MFVLPNPTVPDICTIIYSSKKFSSYRSGQRAMMLRLEFIKPLTNAVTWRASRRIIHRPDIDAQMGGWQMFMKNLQNEMIMTSSICHR